MENQGSHSTDTCPHCGKSLVAPVEQAPPPAETAAAVPSDALLVHEPSVSCSVCGRELSTAGKCERLDCPRVAAQHIHQASLDTPFRLGL